MGQITTGVAETVNVTGDLPPPVPSVNSQIQVHYEKSITIHTTTLTVPNGKKWYVIGYSCAASNHLHGEIELKLNGDIWDLYIGNGSATYHPYMAKTVMFPFPAVPILTEGQTIEARFLYAVVTVFSLWYIEVDA